MLGLGAHARLWPHPTDCPYSWLAFSLALDANWIVDPSDDFILEYHCAPASPPAGYGIAQPFWIKLSGNLVTAYSNPKGGKVDGGTANICTVDDIRGVYGHFIVFYHAHRTNGDITVWFAKNSGALQKFIVTNGGQETWFSSTNLAAVPKPGHYHNDWVRPPANPRIQSRLYFMRAFVQCEHGNTLADGPTAQDIYAKLLRGAVNNPTPVPPTANPTSSDFSTATLSVTLSAPGMDAIRYTTDGTQPDAAGANVVTVNAATAPLTITGSATAPLTPVWAQARLATVWSGSVRFAYTYVVIPVPGPTGVGPVRDNFIESLTRRLVNHAPDQQPSTQGWIDRTPTQPSGPVPELVIAGGGGYVTPSGFNARNAIYCGSKNMQVTGYWDPRALANYFGLQARVTPNGLAADAIDSYYEVRAYWDLSSGGRSLEVIRCVNGVTNDGILNDGTIADPHPDLLAWSTLILTGGPQMYQFTVRDIPDTFGNTFVELSLNVDGVPVLYVIDKAANRLTAGLYGALRARAVQTTPGRFVGPFQIDIVDPAPTIPAPPPTVPRDANGTTVNDVSLVAGARIVTWIDGTSVPVNVPNNYGGLARDTDATAGAIDVIVNPDVATDNDFPKVVRCKVTGTNANGERAQVYAYMFAMLSLDKMPNGGASPGAQSHKRYGCSVWIPTLPAGYSGQIGETHHTNAAGVTGSVPPLQIKIQGGNMTAVTSPNNQGSGSVRHDLVTGLQAQTWYNIIIDIVTSDNGGQGHYAIYVNNLTKVDKAYITFYGSADIFMKWGVYQSSGYPAGINTFQLLFRQFVQSEAGALISDVVAALTKQPAIIPPPTEAIDFFDDFLTAADTVLSAHTPTRDVVGTGWIKRNPVTPAAEMRAIAASNTCVASGTNAYYVADIGSINHFVSGRMLGKLVTGNRIALRGRITLGAIDADNFYNLRILPDAPAGTDTLIIERWKLGIKDIEMGTAQPSLGLASNRYGLLIQSIFDQSAVIVGARLTVFVNNIQVWTGDDYVGYLAAGTFAGVRDQARNDITPWELNGFQIEVKDPVAVVRLPPPVPTPTPAGFVFTDTTGLITLKSQGAEYIRWCTDRRDPAFSSNLRIYDPRFQPGFSVATEMRYDAYRDGLFSAVGISTYTKFIPPIDPPPVGQPPPPPAVTPPGGTFTGTRLITIEDQAADTIRYSINGDPKNVAGRVIYRGAFNIANTILLGVDAGAAGVFCETVFCQFTALEAPPPPPPRSHTGQPGS